MLTAHFIVALALFGAAIAGVAWLQFPAWLPVAFIASFPVYALALRRLVAWRLAAWEVRARSAIARGEARADPLAFVSDDPLVRAFHPEAVLFERRAALLEEGRHFSPAVACLEEAFRRAPVAERPRLGRAMWAIMRKLPDHGRSVRGRPIYVSAALLAPEPPWELLQDQGDIVLERGEAEAAGDLYERALARADRDLPRFRLMTKLAVATVRVGRFGAADGWLHEAEQIMPTGDPGCEALLRRTQEAISEAKHDHAHQGHGSALVQLALRKLEETE